MLESVTFDWLNDDVFSGYESIPILPDQSIIKSPVLELVMSTVYESSIFMLKYHLVAGDAPGYPFLPLLENSF